MKKKGISLILMIVVAMAAMFMTACGSSSKSETLESYIQNNEEFKAEIDEAFATAKESGVDLSIQGNDIIYDFDLSAMSEVTEEVAKTDMMKAELEAALEKQAGNFGNIAAQVEEETGIQGIQVVINYKYGDEVLCSQTFTSADAEASESSEDSE